MHGTTEMTSRTRLNASHQFEAWNSKGATAHAAEPMNPMTIPTTMTFDGFGDCRRPGSTGTRRPGPVLISGLPGAPLPAAGFPNADLAGAGLLAGGLPAGGLLTAGLLAGGLLMGGLLAGGLTGGLLAAGRLPVGFGGGLLLMEVRRSVLAGIRIDRGVSPLDPPRHRPSSGSCGRSRAPPRVAVVQATAVVAGLGHRREERWPEPHLLTAGLRTHGETCGRAPRRCGTDHTRNSKSECPLTQ